MVIQYTLSENLLTPDPNDYKATVIANRTADMDAVIDRMVQSGSTITRADIVSVLEEFQAALESLLAEGASVVLPFTQYSCSIKGIFTGPTDSFSANRHQLCPVTAPGKRLRKLYQSGLPTEKITPAPATPQLLEYLDVSSNERNSILTPGGMGQILGTHLKVDPKDRQEGIFLIAEDGTESQISTLGQNKPASLIFLLPNALAAGEYTLEVRAKFSSQLRTGKLNWPLRVN